MVSNSMNGNHGHTFLVVWHRPLRGLEFRIGHCVGGELRCGYVTETYHKWQRSFLGWIRLCCSVSTDWREGLASAKHWYSGRIDPQKFRWVLSRMGYWCLPMRVASVT